MSLSDYLGNIITGIFTLAGVVIGFTLAAVRDIIEEKKSYNRLIENVLVMLQDSLNEVNTILSSSNSSMPVYDPFEQQFSTLTYDIIRDVAVSKINPEVVRQVNLAYKHIYDIKELSIPDPMGREKSVDRTLLDRAKKSLSEAISPLHSVKKHPYVPDFIYSQYLRWKS